MDLLPLCKFFMVLMHAIKSQLDDINAPCSTSTNCPVDPKYSKSRFLKE